MSWSGFVKTVNRAGTTLMQKAGAIEKTVDKEFDDEEVRFKNLESKMERIHNETRGYLDALTALSTAQLRTAEILSQFAGTESELTPVATRYVEICTDIKDEVHSETADTIKETILEPVGRVVACFPDINDAIKRRHKKVLDYDAARSKAMKMAGKPNADPILQQKAEAIAQETQDVYESLNRQLVTEIPKLIESRVQLLDPCFEALVKTQIQFSERSYNKLYSLQQNTYNEEGLDNEINASLQRMSDLSISGLL